MPSTTTNNIIEGTLQYKVCFTFNYIMREKNDIIIVYMPLELTIEQGDELGSESPKVRASIVDHVHSTPH